MADSVEQMFYGHKGTIRYRKVESLPDTIGQITAAPFVLIALPNLYAERSPRLSRIAVMCYAAVETLFG